MLTAVQLPKAPAPINKLGKGSFPACADFLFLKFWMIRRGKKKRAFSPNELLIVDLPWLGKELLCPMGSTAREFQGEAPACQEFTFFFFLELSPKIVKLWRCRNNTQLYLCQYSRVFLYLCQCFRVFISFLEGTLELREETEQSQWLELESQNLFECRTLPIKCWSQVDFLEFETWYLDIDNWNNFIFSLIYTHWKANHHNLFFFFLIHPSPSKMNKMSSQSHKALVSLQV